jgi:hypothetical protein
MSRRAMVMVLAAVIAVAVAIPALAAGGGAEAGSVKSLSLRSLAKAKLALRTSRGAKRSAHAAASSAALAQIAATGAKAAATEAFGKASSAREVAGGAELKASEAKEAFASTHVKVAVAEGTQTVTGKAFKKLSEGPAVAVSVPAGTGLVQVWAQATVMNEGDVSLYVDNEQAPGQAECAAPNPGEGGLFENPTEGPAITLATPAVGPECANSGAPAPVLFQTTAGPHTFELRYAACGCVGPPFEATFSERRLVVQPLP